MKKHSKKTPTNYLIIFLAILLLFAGYLYKVYLDPNVDYLAYAGAIVGGLFTVVGVTMTINYENDIRKEDQLRHDQERKEELAIQYKPMIILKSAEVITNDQEIPDFINDLYEFSINTEKIENSHERRFLINLENVGFGEAYITDGKIFSVDLDNDCTIIRNIGNPSTLNTIIPNKNHIFLGVSIYENIDLEKLPVFFNLKMYVVYRDLFHFYYYKKEVVFQFELSVDVDDNNKKLILYNYSGNDSMIDYSYDSNNKHL